MLAVKYTNIFKKDLKHMKKRGLDINELKKVVKLLAENGKLPNKYKEHYLLGNYRRI